MKITLLCMVLLIALSTKPLHGAAGHTLDQVYDTSGKLVRVSSTYYIVPASSNVGGLALAPTGQDCPLDVVVIDGYLGLLVSFTPVNTKKGVIRVSTDLNIFFPVEKRCPQLTLWKLKDFDYLTGQWFVTTGGEFHNPGPQTVTNWFKIKKYEDAYKLVYCPSVCNDCNYQCSDIGIYEDQYGKRLALSNVPYKVQFKLA